MEVSIVTVISLFLFHLSIAFRDIRRTATRPGCSKDRSYFDIWAAVVIPCLWQDMPLVLREIGERRAGSGTTEYETIAGLEMVLMAQ